MMGRRQVEQAALFYEFSLEKHVPVDHPAASGRPIPSQHWYWRQADSRPRMADQAVLTTIVQSSERQYRSLPLGQTRRQAAQAVIRRQRLTLQD